MCSAVSCIFVSAASFLPQYRNSHSSKKFDAEVRQTKAARLQCEKVPGPSPLVLSVTYWAFLAVSGLLKPVMSRKWLLAMIALGISVILQSEEFVDCSGCKPDL